MHVLNASRDRSLRPELAWTGQVQARITALLAEGRSRLERADAGEWTSLASQWRGLLRNLSAPLRAAVGSPVTSRVVSEKSYAEFRVQKIVFESFPGWQVGLNLFLPLDDVPHVPVLCPCGHGPKWQGDHQLPPQVLARSGFAAALFDMPMFGEKERGNDHFIQGSQAAMTGTWANFFFLVDAMRTADYLFSRADIDTTHGLGVTGVSGGGTATLFLASIDPRVRVIAPVCSVASLGGHVIEGLYTGCPESFMPGQAALGFDMDHLLCLAAPLPCLVAAGTEDEMFRKENVERSVRQARRVYERAGAGERLSLFFDTSPHAYTAPMANEAASWFRRWLLGAPPTDTVTDITLLSREDLDCGTGNSTDGMVQVIRREVTRLSDTRRAGATTGVSAETLRALCGLRQVRADRIERLPRETWGYARLDRLALVSDGEPSLPVLVAEFPDAPAGTLACFVDDGKMSVLRQRGGFFGACRRIVTADIRGFGELEPEPSPYDLYAWCSVDRPLSDLLILCGQTALGEQVMDVLRVLEALGTGESLTVYGRGEAALPALFAGLLHGRVSRIVLESFPCSFESIAVAESPAWKRYAYLPNVLRHFDVPDLVRHGTDRAFLLYRPCDAEKKPVSDMQAREIYAPLPGHVDLRAGADLADAAGPVREWLAR